MSCVACSGGKASSDGGADGGSGGANGGSGGANGGSGGAIAGSGGASTVGSGGAGTSGVAGSGGPGTAGTGPAGTCTFDVQHMPSWAIGTVEIVTWTLDVADLTEAHVDFGPAGAAPTMTAPVDLRDPTHRTLLIGMKGAKPYTFRIVATDGAKTCTSADFSFTTGAVPSTVPKIMKTGSGAGAAKGFIVTSPGVEVTIPPGRPDAYIFDTDGDIVWWSPSSTTTGNARLVPRAHLGWDARDLWVMANGGGSFLRVSMDGVTTSDFTNVIRGHHDFTVLPDGAIALIVGPAMGGAGQSIVEMKPDGTRTTVVADLATLYGSATYPNSLHYYAADDSYTVGDRQANAYVKFKRNGQLVWQLGGSSPKGKSFTLVGLTPWMVNHGHHLTADGHFVFFNNIGANGNEEMPRVLELMLDETAGTATKTWEYQGRGQASYLGDAERLPNGNVLVTISAMSTISEVDRSGTVVQSFGGTTFGYVDFRTSLYGPPPR